ncbi:Porphobilinogen deaminase (EC 2.5.1.61) [uncultured Gammaproteobacteria bacterium]|jgi:hydroxymethylbilane synthase|uniref:Porphobilinogen deaminase n=3 Tax=sulfur-oxidizing symbionts TaxID=32036 RepID=A0A1H6JNP3_9GAMM|nr:MULTISPECIES: hydroxymethylbilane synthase [sulfur-oxidizing symbionts]CAC5844163.1 Porphobilinogen deaminase (EC 2.5.1.61) [uncultured Gammaproteobacteria bacterium]CAB5503730.1 Porphobilinogen deaminase (EC [Bathymodiolus thermophilus thioautotrophic gill symbiont]CAB5506323.1 Porphobilinogen deaminase (EC [Bathymodiolus azoricus thioautotrophic gill symbiont]CAC9488215.1 Porphobilinogen deaminase (EC 2.5.1.61) [uncultured Gammaproteobacteria bacterium]CAC9508329.1 Porphobilinogen deamina
MQQTIKIATRKSPLALWQAEHVKSKLEQLYPDLMVELVKMTTKGDQILNSPLSKIGGKGLFIKELEVGLLEGKADIAVHSMKDVPYEIPEGFELGAILKRENPFDAFVSNDFDGINDLPQGAKVGTCSMRRIVQLKATRPDLEILDLRGNVNTRLQKLDNGEFDGIILACAGLIRLGFEDRIKQQISAEQSLPAVGQGAVGIEIRENDQMILDLIKPLIDKEATYRVSAERAMNARLEGGCSVPIAGYSTINGEQITLTGLVGNVDSGVILKHQASSNIDAVEALGVQLAEKLIEMGAREILK